MARFTVTGAAPISMDTLQLFSIIGSTIADATDNTLVLISPQGVTTTITGSGFSFQQQGDVYLVTGGSVSNIAVTGTVNYSFSNFNVPLTTLTQWAANSDVPAFLATVFSGADTILGNVGSDVLYGFDGNDNIQTLGGRDTVFAGAGNDIIVGTGYLRGGEGNDIIDVGARGGFNDLHGNQGNDTITGGFETDWVVGGQGNDSLFGMDGFDVVYGNMGNDWVEGGQGNDWVRGGQGDDFVYGGGGDDLLWGDRGNDTITGAGGADTFHTFVGADIDRVTDFRYADGDRVVIEGGAAYTLSQEAGANGMFNTVISLDGDTRMILVGVVLDTLPAGWISVV